MGITDYLWLKHPDGTIYTHGDLFLKALETNLDDKTCLNDLPFYINDPEFAQAIIDMSYRISPDNA